MRVFNTHIFDLMQSRHNQNLLNRMIEENFALHFLETLAPSILKCEDEQVTLD